MHALVSRSCSRKSHVALKDLHTRQDIWLQARADDLEEQVAAAEAELEELEASQRQLEARNAVLETFTNLSLTPAAPRNIVQPNVLVRRCMLAYEA